LGGFIKMRKKLSVMLLSLLIVCFSVPVTTLADEDYPKPIRLADEDYPKP